MSEYYVYWDETHTWRSKVEAPSQPDAHQKLLNWDEELYNNAEEYEFIRRDVKNSFAEPVPTKAEIEAREKEEFEAVQRGLANIRLGKSRRFKETKGGQLH